ncbi:MAG: 2-oxo acid dehydrogenase subunit E2 [Firmicutes bacterium]|nr:2-oxo acid dehydrogenase subunit E2 [Alicyclobacillaceae bacterium]MCL6496499.1 2-oxo acid dehydrogenase subunit E2 [Bacillota bacterium]
MTIAVRLPQWGMGMQEGTVLRWLKAVGDPVQQGEALAEIDAAKVTQELPAPASGVLTRILVAEGTTVPVRTVLCELATEGGESPGPSPEPPSAAPSAVPPPPVPKTTPSARPPASPRVQRLAHQLGVDLTRIAGTGPGGRVTEEDVRRAAAPAEPAGRLVALTPMRRTIARRMVESVTAMAQVTLFSEVDVSALAEARASGRLGYAFTYTDAVIRAAALALREHPMLNASWTDEGIRLWPAIHVGVAVALEDGLLVPVIRHADRLTLSAIAEAVHALAARARAGTLDPEAVSGGTFTVTSLGMYGVDAFTPIINPPEAAALGVGRAREQLVRVDRGMEWRTVMTLSLTFDHRVVDGAPAAAFLQTVARHLADPSLWEG